MKLLTSWYLDAGRWQEASLFPVRTSAQGCLSVPTARQAPPCSGSLCNVFYEQKSPAVTCTVSPDSQRASLESHCGNQLLCTLTFVLFFSPWWGDAFWNGKNHDIDDSNTKSASRLAGGHYVSGKVMSMLDVIPLRSLSSFLIWRNWGSERISLAWDSAPGSNGLKPRFCSVILEWAASLASVMFFSPLGQPQP